MPGLRGTIRCGQELRMSVLRRLLSTVTENRRLILVCFEVFWIIIAILWSAGSAERVTVPEFIYVNF